MGLLYDILKPKHPTVRPVVFTNTVTIGMQAKLFHALEEDSVYAINNIVCKLEQLCVVLVMYLLSNKNT